MPGLLDYCITGTYEPGNIPASSGITPVRVLLRDPIEGDVSEAASADAAQYVGLSGAVIEAASASSVQDWISAGVERSAMLPSVFVNSDGTPRQANVDGIMVNL
jgi:hypothetical protein